jgi:type IV secretory pathway TraG/TraD family ATPase VirD4
MKEFFSNLWESISGVFQVGAGVLGCAFGCLLQLLGIGLVIWVWMAIKAFFNKLAFYWQDYTTGFLKMKQMRDAQSAEAVMNLDRYVSETPYQDYSLFLGKTERSGFADIVRMPGDYRTTHMYVIGASGSGKSSLLKNLIIQDILNGMGIAVLDPHGDLVSDILPFLKKRMEHTVLLDLADTEHMLPYNPLERRPNVLVAEQVAKLILAFKRIWGDSWGPRMENILRCTLTLLIEQGYTLADFEKVLTDADFREMLLEESNDQLAIEYFRGRYNTWSSKERSMNTEAVLNKVTAFLADERIGARMSQKESAFNIKDLMDSGGILLVNLAKGRLAGNADLFGALLMADIEMSFLSRQPNERRPFAIYADEFQNIATESFDTVLAEARKFGICLTIAHQSLKQLDDQLVSLILGNAQTQVFFRVSRQDAERLSKEAMNIVEQLYERDDHLIQEPEQKFTLNEMWEVAFHNLATLQAREAFVTVKGVMEHPEKMRTLDNPREPAIKYPFDERYMSLAELRAGHLSDRGKLEKRIKGFNKRDDADDSAPPADLDFIEEK